MGSAISSLTIRKIIQEIKPKIEDKYLNKVQQLEKNLYRFRFSPGSKDLLIEPGKRLNITKYRLQAPKQATQASMIIRKHLENTKLEKINQKGFDRVVEMTFTNGNKVIAEIFGEGNLILTDKDKKIIYAHRRGEWKHRKIIKNAEYKYPPSDTNSFYQTDLEEFKKQLEEKEEDKKIVVLLATDYGLGGKIAEHICKEANIDKNKKNLEETEIEKIYEKTKKTLEKEPKPVKQGEKINPFPLEGEIDEKYNSISQAIDENYTEKQEKTEKSKELKKLEKRLKHQKEAIKGFKEKIKENKKKGDLIYKNYDKVAKAIELFNKGKEGREKLQELGVELKDGKIILELEEPKKE